MSISHHVFASQCCIVCFKYNNLDSIKECFHGELIHELAVIADHNWSNVTLNTDKSELFENIRVIEIKKYDYIRNHV